MYKDASINRFEGFEILDRARLRDDYRLLKRYDIADDENVKILKMANR